jgi:chaperone modulatory protein CbpM
MVKHGTTVIGEGTQNTVLSVDELCEICHISPDFIGDLVAYDIIHAASFHERQCFNIQEIQRVQTALRLRRDLEINLAGIAVVLDLLEERQELRDSKQTLEKILHKLLCP